MAKRRHALINQAVNAASAVTSFNTRVGAVVPAAGDYDAFYYTETELNAGQLNSLYYTEAEIDALDALVVHLAGTETITGAKTFTGGLTVTTNPIVAGTVAADFDALTATSYGGILEANLVDKSATETISGAWTFTGGLTVTTNPIVAGTVDADFDAITGTSYGGILEANLLSRIVDEDLSSAHWTFQDLSITDTTPAFRWTETPATADEGVWAEVADNDEFQLRCYNDAFTLFNEVYTVTRTGYVPDSVDFNCNISTTGGYTGATFGSVNSGNLVDRSASATISGDWSFAKLRATNTDDLSLSSTNHGFQIGATGGTNLRMDNNEIMVANAGVAAGMHLQADGGELSVNFNTAGSLTLRRGSAFEIYDPTNIDFMSLSHDGTDFIMAATTTTDWNLTGITALNWSTVAGVNLSGTTSGVSLGGQVRVYDSTVTDFCAFSHDGTDFNAAMTNTTDWNITGQTNVLIDGSGGLFIRDASSVQKFNLNIAGGLLDIRDGLTFRIRDSGDTDYASFAHDGTNFTETLTNTSHRIVTGGTGGFQLKGGMDLYVYDAAGADYVFVAHDGTNAVIQTGGTDGNDFYFQPEGTTKAVIGVSITQVRNDFRIYDSGVTDYASFSHDGTDFTTTCANTTDWNITGITSIKANASLLLQERAAADVDAAGYGQLWVKNTTPCQLWFTDDAGTDTQIV